MGPRSFARRNLTEGTRPILRLARRIEVVQVRWFGRSLLSSAFRTPVLVLETTGRSTGRRRATVLAHRSLGGGELLIVGGAAGQARTPDWVANLRARPDGHVTVDRRRRPMVADELTGDERREAWEAALAVWPRIARYQEQAGRRVPLFRLRPSEPARSH